MDGMHVFLMIMILALLVFIAGLVFGIRVVEGVRRDRWPPYPPY